MWVRTPRSSTYTAWGGPYTVSERWRRLTTRCRRRGPASLIHRRWFAVVATAVEASRDMHRLARAPERGSFGAPQTDQKREAGSSVVVVRPGWRRG
jgi:hypothetical protein